MLWGDPQGTRAADLSPNSPLARLIAIPGQLAELAAAVDQLSNGGAASLAAPADLTALADKTPEEIADVLKSVLGDKSDAVASALRSGTGR